MSTDSGREFVRKQLSGIGYEASCIPETPESGIRRADVRALLAEQPAVIVEVKTREEDKEFFEELSRAEPWSPVTKRPQEIGYSGTTSDIIASARDQLDQTRESESEIAGLWLLVFDAAISNSAIELLESTLYGRALVWCDDARLRYAFYAGITRFYENPSLDFAVAQSFVPVLDLDPEEGLRSVAEKQRHVLYQNPFSPRLSILQRTAIFEHFSRMESVAPLPEDQEAAGDAFIVELGEDLDLRDRSSVERFLQRKYPNRGIMGIHNVSHYGSAMHIAPPDGESEESPPESSV